MGGLAPPLEALSPPEPKLRLFMSALIYLGQLHWINLSRARLGREGTRVYADLLAELRAAVATGRVVVPLSFTHYFEVSKIGAAQRRAELALTMAELSRYTTLTAREVLMRHEIPIVARTRAGRPLQSSATSHYWIWSWSRVRRWYRERDVQGRSRSSGSSRGEGR
jgi:hypothetical protein